MKWTKLMQILDNFFDGRDIIIYWEDGLVVKCVMNTMSETDNILELDDPNYKDYYMAVVEIKEIIHPSKSPNPYVYVGALMEVSEEFEPLKIELEDHTVIWKRGDV